MVNNSVRTKPVRRAAPPIGRFGAKVFAGLAGLTKFVDPNLAANWGTIVGAEMANLCRPGRLAGGRFGRTLEVVAPNGAAAARVQFEAETIRQKVNDFMGPNAVAQIAVRQSGPTGRREPSDDNDRSPLGAALSRFRGSISNRGKPS